MKFYTISEDKTTCDNLCMVIWFLKSNLCNLHTLNKCMNQALNSLKCLQELLKFYIKNIDTKVDDIMFLIYDISGRKHVHLLFHTSQISDECKYSFLYKGAIMRKEI